MSRPPSLTDRKALARNRERATADRQFFLFDEVIFEIEERLKDVNRVFTSPAIVTGFDVLSGLAKDATVAVEGERLALSEAAHDLVLHLMSLHWADDPVGQLVQSRLALRPDGFFLAVCFGGTTLNELRSSLAQAESELSGGLSPRVAPMADLRDLGALMQRAGFALPVADARRLRVTYPDLATLARDLRIMGETNALAGRLRSFTGRDLFLRAEEIYGRHFSDGGKLVATFELAFLSGWAPGPDQPQPLRPGSATARLADALDATEIELPGDDTPR